MWTSYPLKLRSCFQGNPFSYSGIPWEGPWFFYVKKGPPTSLQGIISTSPALGPARPVPGWKISHARVMKRIRPTMAMDNGLDLTGNSRNPNVIAAYKSDPLVHPLVSARLGWDLL